ncbi:unnamed protein product [Adineta steineri]|uniref:Uncharacterized protein n=1 Tax=Adineta steineri TaxID=433720 RepID=A0A815CIW7_9BILA|nr:unnamed protein product [Adineta steineri]CAF1285757.1 unnamed protein product [Adineta steineri]
MVVDIALQQQLPEIFNTNHSHHHSSSSSSSPSSSSSSSTYKRNTTSSNNTMTNGHRLMSNELGKKAEQILGHATSVVDYRRQQSMDLCISHPLRLNIDNSKSRATNQQIPPVSISNRSNISKNRHMEAVEQLEPLILKLVAPLSFTKLPEIISRHSKHVDHINESHQAVLALPHETNINLSEDENEEEEEEEDDDEEEQEEEEDVNDDEDHKIPNENPIKIQHSDSDNDDNDDTASTHSNTENDDESNRTNPNTFSLSDFISGTHSPIETTTTTTTTTTNIRKRSLSPPTPVEQIKPNKYKEELITSFSLSVNIPMDMKQPKLPIAIPTYLFYDQSIKTENNQKPEKSQRISKRDINGSIKQETNIDMIDNLTTVNSTQQKKSKTSHVYKQEPAIVSTLTHIKEEPNTMSNIKPSNEISFAGNMATIAPMIGQPKKEKPTANVKPLLQTALVDNSSSTTNNSNVVNPPDRLLTTASTSAKTNYANLRTMSTKELNSLAREKKKQADSEKRTFDDVKKSMSLYLESVCYFIQCANGEPILEQRRTLLTATLAMLQHLAINYQKVFQISILQSTEILNHLRPKFHLINYWLQSYIYQLQYNTNFPSIERCATQVNDYLNHTKSPEDINPNVLHDFSKYMINSYYSTYYWNKAERLTRDEPSKKFLEQLIRQNQNRRLTRDDTTFDFLLYIFDAIDLLRLTVI